LPDAAARFDQQAAQALIWSQETTMQIREEIHVRPASLQDCERVARMCAELWPGASAEDHLRELAPKVEGRSTRLLPVAVFVAERPSMGSGTNSEDVVGFVEVGLRSHADGCDESHEVGFIEGWFIAKEWRNRGIGRKLVLAAEDWARSQGCREMASDTWIDNTASQRAHEAMGYEVVDRCVNYRKFL
jgi:aminoglycoside 6'-N-acetyltransferase I